MIAIQSFSQTIFFCLAFGLPVLAIGLGRFEKQRLLVAAFIGQLAILIICLGTLYHLVETGKYPEATGMEGIALFLMPAVYVASVLISTILYFVAASTSRHSQAKSRR